MIFVLVELTESFEGNVYYFIKQWMTYDEGKEFCNKRGWALVSIKSKGESDFLNARLKGNTWTSGRRVGNSNDWTWAGSNVAWPAATPANSDGIFRNWNQNEPNNFPHSNGEKENCIMLRPHTAPTTWNDSPCSSRYNIICESSITGSKWATSINLPHLP